MAPKKRSTTTPPTTAEKIAPAKGAAAGALDGGTDSEDRPKEHKEGAGSQCCSSTILLVTAAVAVLSAVFALGDRRIGQPATQKDSRSAHTARAPAKHLHWEKVVSPDGPTPRLAHAVAVVGDSRMYVHGGLFGFSNLSKSDLWAFDDVSETWTEVKPTGEIPSPRFHHSLVSADDKELLLFAGFNVFNTDPKHDSLDDLYAFDLASNSWLRLLPPVDAPRPTKRGAHDAVWYLGAMYVFGGWEKIGVAGHSNELWKFHRASVRWTSLTPTKGDSGYPAGRFGFAWGTIDEHLYLYGGGCPSGAHETEHAGQCADMWRYAPEQNAWTHLQASSGPHPPPRRATHGDASFAGHLYIFGGVHVDASQKPPKLTMYDDFHVYDAAANVWSALEIGKDELKPPKTFGHSVAALKSHIVVFGGRAEVPTSPGTNQLWRFHLLSSE